MQFCQYGKNVPKTNYYKALSWNKQWGKKDEHTAKVTWRWNIPLEDPEKWRGDNTETEKRSGEGRGQPKQTVCQAGTAFLNSTISIRARGGGGGGGGRPSSPQLLSQLQCSCLKAQVRDTTHTNDDPLTQSEDGAVQLWQAEHFTEGKGLHTGVKWGKLRASGALINRGMTYKRSGIAKVYKGIISPSFTLSAHTLLGLMTHTDFYHILMLRIKINLGYKSNKDQIMKILSLLQCQDPMHDYFSSSVPWYHQCSALTWTAMFPVRRRSRRRARSTPDPLGQTLH